MQKWEYYVLYLTWDRGRNEFYLDIKSAGGRVFGEEKILDFFGAQGWELVSAFPAFYRGEFAFNPRSGDGAFGGGVNDYKVLLKRSKS
ncbi:MAG TPA: hypothetical protein VEP90_08505 [Methylomirabilota bacterium]|nr:hypothetical protein [Ktedonobacteraceae bacterium]HYT42374.1 hypothetical protein [Methylomirabilota bacterium]